MPQRNSPNRRAILATRRAAQRSRQPGFTAVPNKRVNGAMQAMAVLVAMENEDQVKRLGVARMSTEEIQREAVNRVTRSLPSPGVSYLFRRRPSMNDSAVYRGQGGMGPMRLATLCPPVTVTRKVKVAAL